MVKYGFKERAASPFPTGAKIGISRCEMALVTVGYLNIGGTPCAGQPAIRAILIYTLLPAAHPEDWRLALAR
jgi:hypothetical protein